MLYLVCKINITVGYVLLNKPEINHMKYYVVGTGYDSRYPDINIILVVGTVSHTRYIS